MASSGVVVPLMKEGTERATPKTRSKTNSTISAFLMILNITTMKKAILNFSVNMQLNKKGKAVLLLLFVLALIISQTGCDKKETGPETLSKDGFFLDTVCTITVYDLEGATSSNDFAEKAEAAIDGAFELCGEYENLLSKTIETSDVARINAAGGEAVECDGRTIEVINDGIQFGYISEGSFNIGIGTVTDLWDFHAVEPVVPADDAIKNAIEHVHNCAITSSYINTLVEGNKVTLSDPESKIDLGGIAKGYIADALGEYLVGEGVTGGVIDLGGNIVVIGYKNGGDAEEGEPIRVGIKKPYTETNEIVGTLALHDACVVTSGIYERYFEVDGVKYHHILNPETGYPVDSEFESITVVGPLGTSEECDALATTILIKGKAWLEKALMGEGILPNPNYLEDFGFILIDKEGNLETLGKDVGFQGI